LPDEFKIRQREEWGIKLVLTAGSIQYLRMTLEITTYADAIHHVKRGFLTIGLTGFTGSGCSTARRILESTTKQLRFMSIFYTTKK